MGSAKCADAADTVLLGTGTDHRNALSRTPSVPQATVSCHAKAAGNASMPAAHEPPAYDQARGELGHPRFAMPIHKRRTTTTATFSSVVDSHTSRGCGQRESEMHPRQARCKRISTITAIPTAAPPDPLRRWHADEALRQCNIRPHRRRFADRAATLVPAFHNTIRC